MKLSIASQNNIRPDAMYPLRHLRPEHLTIPPHFLYSQFAFCFISRGVTWLPRDYTSTQGQGQWF